MGVSSEQAAKGEDHPHARLTVKAVRIIRSSGETATSLARRFGVCRATVSNARRKLTWRSV